MTRRMHSTCYSLDALLDGTPVMIPPKACGLSSSRCQGWLWGSLVPFEGGALQFIIKAKSCQTLQNSGTWAQHGWGVHNADQWSCCPSQAGAWMKRDMAAGVTAALQTAVKAICCWGALLKVPQRACLQALKRGQHLTWHMPTRASGKIAHGGQRWQAWLGLITALTPMFSPPPTTLQSLPVNGWGCSCGKRLATPMWSIRCRPCTGSRPPARTL